MAIQPAQQVDAASRGIERARHMMLDRRPRLYTQLSLITVTCRSNRHCDMPV
jgi:hypothetical protein